MLQLDEAFKKAKERRKKKKGKDADDGDEDYYKILGLQVSWLSILPDCVLTLCLLNT